VGAEGRLDASAHDDAEAILQSLSRMVARTSRAGTLPDGFVEDMFRADPTGARVCGVLDRGLRAGARFGADFLHDVGRLLFAPAAPPPYDGGRAWMLVTAAEPAVALDVLEDRELAGWLLSLSPVRGAAGRARTRLLAAASGGQGGDRRRSTELARWVRESWLVREGVAPTAPYDGLATLLAAEMVTLDEMAGDDDHPGRAELLVALRRMRGDNLAVSALADACTRFNRLRIQGEVPAERPAAVAASCALLDFVLRPLLSSAGQGNPDEGYLRMAADLMAMTGLWSVMRDGGPERPAAVAALWPLGPEGQPVRLAQLGRRAFQEILGTASLTPGLAGDLVAASRRV
jgi:hypothetical protein